MAEIVLNSENGTLPQAEHLRAVEKSAILPRVVQPMLPSKSLSSGFLFGCRKTIFNGDRLFAGHFSGQTLAAFGATSFQNLLAIRCLHAFAKSVATTSLGAARLPSPFHKNSKLQLIDWVGL